MSEHDDQQLTFRFSPEQELRLEQALDRAHEHPEALIPLEEWAKRAGIL